MCVCVCVCERERHLALFTGLRMVLQGVEFCSTLLWPTFLCLHVALGCLEDSQGCPSCHNSDKQSQPIENVPRFATQHAQRETSCGFSLAAVMSSVTEEEEILWSTLSKRHTQVNRRLLIYFSICFAVALILRENDRQMKRYLLFWSLD